MTPSDFDAEIRSGEPSHRLMKGIALMRRQLTKLLDEDEANTKAMIEEMVFTQR